MALNRDAVGPLGGYLHSAFGIHKEREVGNALPAQPYFTHMQ